MEEELRRRALEVLCEPEPARKAAQALALQQDAAGLPVAERAPAAAAPVPGRPARPLLVHPARVPGRSPQRPDGMAALLHAIAHIEFNAINLALDAAWRFDGLAQAYYHDWVRVAAEEAFHFGLLVDLLAAAGHAYGDFPAHDGLWTMCEKTAADPIARMALVPRTLEARGLDATPQIQDKLRRVGSPLAKRAVEVLDIILRDEVGHVAIGNRWYRWLCERDGLDPVVHYPVLAARYQAPGLFPPFNEAARLRAGFTPQEIAALSCAPEAPRSWVPASAGMTQG
jgi:uncharacterized ferritin-like protein (DUF455 family)